MGKSKNKNTINPVEGTDTKNANRAKDYQTMNRDNAIENIKKQNPTKK